MTGKIRQEERLVKVLKKFVTGSRPDDEPVTNFPNTFAERFSWLIFGYGDRQIEGEQCEGRTQPWRLPECTMGISQNLRFILFMTWFG